jgi:hypothetical protein
VRSGSRDPSGRGSGSSSEGRICQLGVGLGLEAGVAEGRVSRCVWVWL